MPRKAVAVEVPETGAQVEILLPLARRGRADGDGGRGWAKSPAAPTIPRIARLMALAVRARCLTTPQSPGSGMSPGRG